MFFVIFDILFIKIIKIIKYDTSYSCLGSHTPDKKTSHNLLGTSAQPYNKYVLMVAAEVPSKLREVFLLGCYYYEYNNNYGISQSVPESKQLSLLDQKTGK